MIVRCKYCGINKEKRFLVKYDCKNIKYCDGDGRRWNGARCPDCHVVAMRKDDSSHDNPKNPIHARARNAERAVARLFLSQGFTVKESRGKGPDLVIQKGSEEKTCEVKSANPHGTSLRVCAVKPARRGDDLVAIVIPDGRIVFETMKAHLSKCDKSGSRTVTGL